MSRKNILLILAAAIIGAIIATLASRLIFNSPASRVKVPVIDKIDPTFPDVNNDSNYHSFLNRDSLDPTQPIQIGNSSNIAPFNQ